MSLRTSSSALAAFVLLAIPSKGNLTRADRVRTDESLHVNLPSNAPLVDVHRWRSGRMATRTKLRLIPQPPATSLLAGNGVVVSVRHAPVVRSMPRADARRRFRAPAARRRETQRADGGGESAARAGSKASFLISWAAGCGGPRPRRLIAHLHPDAASPAFGGTRKSSSLGSRLSAGSGRLERRLRPRLAALQIRTGPLLFG